MKVILFLILAGITFYFVLLNECVGPQGFLACLSNVQKIIYGVLAPFMALVELINGKSIIYLFITVLFLIFQILYTYTIGCLIAYLFMRNKQRKEVARK